jgi:hypothetical protein
MFEIENSNCDDEACEYAVAGASSKAANDARPRRRDIPVPVYRPTFRQERGNGGCTAAQMNAVNGQDKGIISSFR